MQQQHHHPGAPSVLANLRSLLPSRPIGLLEALTIAERQAERLRRLRGVSDVPVSVEIVTDLPRIAVAHDREMTRRGASGAVVWDRKQASWVIKLNPDEPLTRRRFSLFHEYKHIIDYGHAGLRGPLPRTLYGLEPSEYIADYFAGCVLMPKRQLNAVFYEGTQRPADLSELFDVSARAIEVRLTQVGLTDDEPGHKRHTPPGSGRRKYSSHERRSSSNWHSPRQETMA